MKKLLTCLVSAGLLLSMSACSKSNDKALEATVTGLNNMAKMESASYTLGMEMGVMGETVAFDMYGGYLQTSDKKVQVSFAADLKEGGIVENLMSAYLKDDMLYLDLSGEKAKMPMTDILNGLSMDTSNDTDSNEITKEDIKPYIKEAKLDGSNIELTLDEKQIEEALKESVEENLAGSGYTAKLTVNTATVTLEIKDDFIVDASLDLDLKMNMDTGDGVDANVNMTMSLYTQFKDINANKEIMFPEFNEDYIEISPMDLLGALGQEL